MMLIRGNNKFNLNYRIRTISLDVTLLMKCLKNTYFKQHKYQDAF